MWRGGGHNHLRIGQYHQHLTESLNGEQSPLEYMVGVNLKEGREVWGEEREREGRGRVQDAPLLPFAPFFLLHPLQWRGCGREKGSGR